MSKHKKRTAVIVSTQGLAREIEYTNMASDTPMGLLIFEDETEGTQFIVPVASVLSVEISGLKPKSGIVEAPNGLIVPHA